MGQIGLMLAIFKAHKASLGSLVLLGSLVHGDIPARLVLRVLLVSPAQKVISEIQELPVLLGQEVIMDHKVI